MLYINNRRFSCDGDNCKVSISEQEQTFSVGALPQNCSPSPSQDHYIVASWTSILTSYPRFKSFGTFHSISVLRPKDMGKNKPEMSKPTETFDTETLESLLSMESLYYNTKILFTLGLV